MKKTCSKCKKSLPLENYSKRENRKCGVMSACKKCLAEKARAYRRSKHGFEITRKAEKKYLLTAKGQKTRITKLDNRRANKSYNERRRARERTNEQREKNKIRRRTYLSLEKNKIKEQARSKLSHAVKSGKILKSPCIECGNPKSEGHHPNYNKPLDVIWLCKYHHSEFHFIERRMEARA